MDNKALLALWDHEEMPACPEGMMLAQAFLISCGEGVNRLGIEEPSEPHHRYDGLLHGLLMEQLRWLRQLP